MKNAFNYFLDALLAVTFAAMGFIGFLLAYFIPKGAEAPGYEKYLWGLHRHEWGDLHHYICLAFVALVVIHLGLHWKWLKHSTRRRFPRSLALWFLLVMAAAAAFVWGGALLIPKGQYEGAGVHRVRAEGRVLSMAEASSDAADEGPRRVFPPTG